MIIESPSLSVSTLAIWSLRQGEVFSALPEKSDFPGEDSCALEHRPSGAPCLTYDCLSIRRETLRPSAEFGPSNFLQASRRTIRVCAFRSFDPFTQDVRIKAPLGATRGLSGTNRRRLYRSPHVFLLPWCRLPYKADLQQGPCLLQHQGLTQQRMTKF